MIHRCPGKGHNTGSQGNWGSCCRECWCTAHTRSSHLPESIHRFISGFIFVCSWLGPLPSQWIGKLWIHLGTPGLQMSHVEQRGPTKREGKSSCGRCKELAPGPNATNAGTSLTLGCGLPSQELPSHQIHKLACVSLERCEITLWGICKRWR